MFKKLIVTMAFVLMAAGAIYAANMGMGLDMGMSTGGGAGGSFPVAGEHFLEIDGSGNFLEIDGAGHKLRIDGAS